ncbi:MAG: NAD-dependent epimerase/dehydratase family protein [Deltaproteobacteria bacterium]|nr:NAD-dependent epimerase/dehydratase family protein [Deltaproteobacteria bacterium]
MKAVVTGGAGFIGSHLVRALLDAGIDVRVFDLPQAVRENLAGLPVEWHPGDLTRPDDVLDACEGMDLVFHLAALVSDWGEWNLFERVNVGGTRNVLDAARVTGSQRTVMMSSLAVHPYTGWRMADETTPREPGGNPYRRSKILAEDICREAVRNGQPVTVIRPGVFPFGERDRTSFLPLVKALKSGLYVHINRGDALITTAYAGNLARGMVQAALSERAAGETYILGDAEPVRWRDLMARIALRVGAPVPTASVPGWFADRLSDGFEAVWSRLGRKEAPPLTRYRTSVPQRDLWFVSAKAGRHFGYQPETGLNEALDRTVQWWRTVR